ncbi:E2F transcription factor-like E2FE [Silene latifolia]|uniref:E2F transcription factor-like E2FE n=1 Tax=Silene latifolia TaxID=37657 RepID=UPI003D781BB4
MLQFQVLDLDDDVASNPGTGSQSEAPTHSGASKLDNRREKSLGLLTQNFVKLFLGSEAELISLEEAAKCLLGDGLNAQVMRTKVRRL